MKHDFRTVEEEVRKAVDKLDMRDKNWQWKVQVQKGRIKLYWGYLEYLKCENPYFIITDDSYGKNNDGNEIIVARDEYGELLDAGNVGEQFWAYRTLADCVVALIRRVYAIAHERY